MSSFYGPLQDQISALCVATLPALVLPGQNLRGTIFYDYQQLRTSIIEFAKDSEESGPGQPPPPPYLFIAMPEFTTPADWGMNCEVKMVKPTFYYFDTDHDGLSVSVTENDVMEALVPLQQAIDTTAHSLFQSISYGSIDVSPTDPIVRYLQGCSKVRMVGGKISWPDGWQVLL